MTVNSSVSVVDFEKVDVNWAIIFFTNTSYSVIKNSLFPDLHDFY